MAKKKRARPRRVKRDVYEARLEELHIELVKLQYWVKQQGLRVVLVFEGRDAAGKGGMIRRITERVNPSGARGGAARAHRSPAHQMYIQRYVAHLPAAGEIVIFDRSWYNRPGVERVMGFCTEARAAIFSRAPVRGSSSNRHHLDQVLVLDVSEEEQEKRFRQRIV